MSDEIVFLFRTLQLIAGNGTEASGDNLSLGSGSTPSDSNINNNIERIKV